MREQRFKYNRYDWEIRAFYDVDCSDVYCVVSALKDIGCRGEQLFRSVSLIDSCKRNEGLTFANPLRKEMVVMITKTTSPEQFANSFVHEIHHMSEFVASEAGIPFTGEAISYIAGDLAMLMHPVAGRYLCPHCNH